jgi:hypothetical protein
MEELRKQLRRFLPAVMFAASAFALLAMFVNDWIEVAKPVRILAAAPPIEAAAPTPPAEPVEPKAEPMEPVPVDPPPQAAPAEEEPAEKPEEPKKDDPWKAERERMNGGNARRNAGWVQVNPRVIVQMDAMMDEMLNEMRRAPRIGFDMPRLAPFVAPRRIDPQAMMEEMKAKAVSRRVAFAVQGMIFTEVPETRRYVSGFDVAADNGRLIVNVRLAFLDLDDDQRRVVMDGIAAVWRETKYTKRHDCSKAVEFRSPTGWSETLEP